MVNESFLDTDSFSLEVFIDSSDVLYRVSYVAKSDSYEAATDVLDSLINKKITSIAGLGARDFSAEPSLAIEHVLYALKELIKYYQGSDVTKSETSQVELSELICRCKFLDRKTIEKAFLDAKGDFKKAVLATNASMICSSCSSDVKRVFDEMDFPEEKERVEKIRSEIQQALDEFSLFSPPEYAQTTFEVASVKGSVVKVKIINRPDGTKRPQIKQTLENYLGPKALEGLQLSVFF
ncbi:MAG: (2Fe-2S)-binding protein [Bacteriovoracaceae bacterium]|nr:(2Fe-2S)-binding protein [Bacteriovoracaceae bacterium]